MYKFRIIFITMFLLFDQVIRVHDGYDHGHGAHVKHGYKYNHLYGDHGYEHEIKQEHHHGHVPHHR